MKKWVMITTIGLLSLGVLSACGKVQDTKDSETDNQSSTVESTTHTKEKESSIQSKTATVVLVLNLRQLFVETKIN